MGGCRAGGYSERATDFGSERNDTSGRLRGGWLRCRYGERATNYASERIDTSGRRQRGVQYGKLQSKHLVSYLRLCDYRYQREAIVREPTVQETTEQATDFGSETVLLQMQLCFFLSFFLFLFFIFVVLF